jgi:cation transporter-like permease
MTLPDEISNFGSLVGLMLALATLLTANRASTLVKLGEKPTLSKSERRHEVTLDLLLAAVTILTFLGGLPLTVRAAHGLQPLAHEGPIRSVLVMVWVLLVGLIGWQIKLAKAASKLDLSS